MPDVCRWCGQGIADHAMGDAYEANLRRCRGFEAEDYTSPWECKTSDEEFVIQRTVDEGGVHGGRRIETAAQTPDYGLACVIEALMNWRSGTVE